MTLIKENVSLPYAGLVFLFPLGMGSVRHYSSTLLVGMFLLGAWGCLDCRKNMPAAQVRIVTAFLIFLAAISLSLFNAVDIAEGAERLGKMAYFIILVPLFLAVGSVSGTLVNAFMWGLVGAGPINFLIALYSMYFQELSRAQGYYHPIIFGDLNVLGAMLLSVFIYSGQLKGRLAAYLGPLSVLCFLLSCYLSGTRGAWIAVPVALSVALLLYRTSLTRKNFVQMGIGLLVFVAVVAVFHGTLSKSEQRDMRGGQIISSTLENVSSFRRGENLNSSLGQRLLMWKISLDMFRDNPLLGSGLGGFRGEVERLQQENRTPLERAWPHAHSIYFEFLATTGLLGFLSMVACLFVVPAAIFMQSLSAQGMRRLSATAGLVFLACFAVFGLTECWLYRSPMLISYIVCLLIFIGGCAERDPL
jgi:O-antigen ligase